MRSKARFPWRVAASRLSGLLLLAAPLVQGGIADLAVQIQPNGSAYLPAQTTRTVTLVVRNHGPDLAEMPAVVSAEFLIFPIGDLQLGYGPPPTCELWFTDFQMPWGQRLEIASFATPPIPAGGNFQCNVQVTALARQRTSGLLRLGVNDIAEGAFDPDRSNNLAEFRFQFFPVIRLPLHSLGGALLLIGIAGTAGRRLRAS